ncbi:M20/M25/M40 family metallo-hydrolase [Macrococcoides caseolyticum]|uniref:M20/M25/M40 family metallo-hydrolase n=1 Tax=Macrococcoides caseolyticum TaxID=69966 RepID=UPI001F43CE15|nr:M20/M25/M40 family metallo-hydrolase [Macrococcus caseolyticus]MCE4955695.1 M20/M25/M40 family metallo-hydrolase [Macrococcus caseolyticus]
MGLLWQTPEDRLALLKDLVKQDSITNSNGEVNFPFYIKETLKQLDYFNMFDSHIQLIETNDHKNALAAIYRSHETDDTVILMSHYDTVDTNDFGHFEDKAFDCDALTAEFKKNIHEFDDYHQHDIASNRYLFGRGVMDMKSGLMMHMSILEKAISESWPLNIILLTVPDEEVNSSGMRSAVVELSDYITQEALNLKLIMNGEPAFSQKPHDEHYYIYNGSIGKVMPSVLAYGKETHVGEPLNGLSANYLISRINSAIEYNPSFTERYKEEVTPLPVSLYMKDLKEEYNVQTPFMAASFYNVFLFEQSAAHVFHKFNKLVDDTVKEAVKDLKSVFNELPDIKVMTYDMLVKSMSDLHGKKTVQKIIDEIKETDDRTYARRVIEALLLLDHNNDYTVITYLNAPYYPSVNSGQEKLIKSITKYTIKQMKKQFDRETTKIYYFNGISDLSYVNYAHDDSDAQIYAENTPGFGRHYDIPFDAMKQLKAPVINIGAFGKDAHQLTERIDIKSVTEEVPYILNKIFHKFFLD